MPPRNALAALLPEIREWRRDIHRHPEILFDTHRTAALVAAKLREWGCDEVVEGIGRTGVVGVIRGQRTESGRTVALRADMDALPIEEATGLPHASTVRGAMHACGHDGHTAMLLGAARYLCETRAFDGTALVVFQPAEEGGGGGREMVEDGLMERWGVSEIYGMHNWPGRPVGSFAIREGAFFAATDQFEVVVEGRGGHAAKPQETVDPVVAGSAIVLALQTIASRNADPVEQIVVSVTSFRTASDAFNVIPPRAVLRGTVRTLSAGLREMAERRLRTICEATAAAHGAEAHVDYRRGYPVMANHPAETEHARAVAREVSGGCEEAPLVMGGEDFAYMLEARPGAYILLGNGDSAPVHHPEYDFNDEAIPAGCSWLVGMVESRLPLRPEGDDRGR
ncbi:M20 aminoacylase family protein [Rubellimicrobium sp. CFH 75288]|uniref:M20 aminoacylase family protein n=1 Tax=Rubellimicrobium sp. CFH 75288 TaxID=2697034 RepID=UPI0014132DDC|nr:M20 aminoacylase family protein [Rubellimicrobium sp. CFH 75288]NAZ35349.1 amidohydrolase [Rubellimicrobium sp. CFH 75288]